MVDSVDMANQIAEELAAKNLKNTLSKIKKVSVSSSKCKSCGEEIPLARRQVVVGVEYCVDCQNEIEKE